MKHLIRAAPDRATALRHIVAHGELCEVCQTRIWLGDPFVFSGVAVHAGACADTLLARRLMLVVALGVPCRSHWRDWSVRQARQWLLSGTEN